MQPLILPPRLFPAVDYYKTIAQSGSTNWGIALKGRFDKRQKSAHRYTIADTQGTLDLTVPIAKTRQYTPWSKVGISTHGGWWDVHRVTLESAYGRTPFFEFYIDRLLPLLQSPENEGACRTLGELLIRSNTIIAPILGIEPPTENDAVYPTSSDDAESLQEDLEEAVKPVVDQIHLPQSAQEALVVSAEDFVPGQGENTKFISQGAYSEEKPDAGFEEKPDIRFEAKPRIKPYYQVRQHKFGFIPGLSILDLIFNLGPESALYLRDML